MLPSAWPTARRVTRDARSVPRGEDGVSLIALLGIVLVLGVLAAIAITSLGPGAGSDSHGHRATGPTTPVVAADRLVCEASAKVIETAALAYFAGHDGTWPPDIASLTAGDSPLLKREPDPKWGLVYDPATGTVDASGCNRLA